jgi:hypothetical protein
VVRLDAWPARRMTRAARAGGRLDARADWFFTYVSARTTVGTSRVFRLGPCEALDIVSIGEEHFREKGWDAARGARPRKRDARATPASLVHRTACRLRPARNWNSNRGGPRVTSVGLSLPLTSFHHWTRQPTRDAVGWLPALRRLNVWWGNAITLIDVCPQSVCAPKSYLFASRSSRSINWVEQTQPDQLESAVCRP